MNILHFKVAFFARFVLVIFFRMNPLPSTADNY
jgi:hypothetical protein